MKLDAGQQKQRPYRGYYIPARKYGFYVRVFNSIRFFDVLPKPLSKISEDFPKLLQRLVERFQTFSEHFPKILEDNRRFSRTDDVSVKQQHI